MMILELLHQQQPTQTELDITVRETFKRYSLQTALENDRANYFKQQGNKILSKLISKHILSCYESTFILSKGNAKLYLMYCPYSNNAVQYSFHAEQLIDVTDAILQAFNAHYGLSYKYLSNFLADMMIDVGHIHNMTKVEVLENCIAKVLWGFTNVGNQVAVGEEKTTEQLLEELDSIERYSFVG